MDTLRAFVRLSRPLYLLSLFVLYAAGAGIAHYLGETIDWSLHWLGQTWAAILLLGGLYLNEYFQRIHRPLTGNPDQIVASIRLTRTVLVAALACLAALASLTVLMIAQFRLPALAYLLMGSAFLSAFFFSAPPLRLEVSGYGELLLSILAAYLAPAFAYVLQAGAWHRLLSMIGFPLAALHLAMLIALQLPTYAADLKQERRRLLVRMGWQRGMIFHNLLVLIAFLLLALAAVFGFPWSVAWPALLVLPLGLYQLWQMRAIAGGAKPNWPALTVGAMALFAALAYLLAFAFWIN